MAIAYARRQSMTSAAVGTFGRGLTGAAIGFVIGAGLTTIVRASSGHAAWDLEQCIVIGYVRLSSAGCWASASGVAGRRSGSGCDDVAGTGRAPAATSPSRPTTRSSASSTWSPSCILFLLAGLMAMLIRAQLLQPADSVLTNDQYNRVMSMHGIIMIAVAVASVIGGFGNYFVPIMIGADDMAFPRLNALSYWLVPPVAVLLLVAQAFGGWDSGWTAYPPLSVAERARPDRSSTWRSSPSGSRRSWAGSTSS